MTLFTGLDDEGHEEPEAPEDTTAPARVIRGFDLPTLAWLQGLDDPLTTDNFEPTRLPPEGLPLGGMTKPDHGGLWTAPTYPDDEPDITTWWTLGLGGKRHRSVMADTEPTPVWTVIPHPDARVYVIERVTDLTQATTRWPDPRNDRRTSTDIFFQDSGVRAFRHGMNPRINYPAMAEDFDAIYLTRAGYDKLGDITERPNLSIWDGPTVYFLNPTYTPGEQHPLRTNDDLAHRRAQHTLKRLRAVEEHTGEKIPPAVVKLLTNGADLMTVFGALLREQ